MKGSRPSGRGFQRVGIVAKTASAPAVRLARSLERALVRRGRTVRFDEQTAAALRRPDGTSRARISREVDLVLVLGGDGTLLSVARLAPSRTPLLGINVGLLGFLSGLAQDEALGRLDDVLAGRFREDRRRRLDVLVPRGPHHGTYRVLNDAVLNREALARISTFSIALDGRTVSEFRADGVVVSTPTGSTAYNLSAGGPILHPALPAVVITPICPHTLSQRPLVVPASTEIRVRVVGPERRDGGVYLTLDGQEGFPILAGIPVDVRSSASPVTLLRPPDSDHFDQLAGKLSWGV
ncbi:MAG TPA: NAD(+)/NADH kinase [Thermoanaerobaculia bacterium]|jgi:NAD+ kinase|nr:NAD(+)/NADH kinase [Thermoanaerobaculia bacterium]